MWNKPVVLNAIANILFTFVGVFVVYGVLAFAARLPSFALHQVWVANTNRVTRAQIEFVVRQDMTGNFFTLNLNQLRNAFEQLPWVRHADVRREWPDRIDVALEEQTPLAYWESVGSGSLVNIYGEVFNAAYTGALPIFKGPDGSAADVTNQYKVFLRSVAAIGTFPAQVEVSPRRAWRLQLANGLTLELGRDNILARLNRFMAVYVRSIGQFSQQPRYVDLRYPNGFAVRVPG